MTSRRQAPLGFLLVLLFAAALATPLGASFTRDWTAAEAPSTVADVFGGLDYDVGVVVQADRPAVLATGSLNVAARLVEQPCTAYGFEYDVGGRGPGEGMGSGWGRRSRYRLFQSLYTDPVSGISYARNRWYDARTGVWLSEDPMGDADSPSLYAFVGHSPGMYTDPMGLLSAREWAGVFAEAGGKSIREAGKVGLAAGAGLLFGAATVTVVTFSPVIGVALLPAGGLVLADAGVERWGENQTSAQIAGGAVLDTIGVSGLGAAFLDRDLATGQRLNLSHEQRVDALAAAYFAVGAACGGVKTAGALDMSFIGDAAADGFTRGAQVAVRAMKPRIRTPARALETARVSETGRGVFGHSVVQRLAGEAEGALSQANRMLAAGSKETRWAELYQLVRGSGRWFESLARRNALHQLAERQLMGNRYFVEAVEDLGFIVQFNKGSALGARGARGGLLRPDIQIGLPDGRWGIIDWTTEGSAGKIFKYEDPLAPFLVNVTLP